LEAEGSSVSQRIVVRGPSDESATFPHERRKSQLGNQLRLRNLSGFRRKRAARPANSRPKNFAGEPDSLASGPPLAQLTVAEPSACTAFESGEMSSFAVRL
jgi:hypothetical protein